jgi:hypothetical protein
MSKTPFITITGRTSSDGKKSSWRVEVRGKKSEVLGYRL